MQYQKLQHANAAITNFSQFNQACKDSVVKHIIAWEQVLQRAGILTAHENDYNTMNVQHMSQVWSIFKRLYEKKLIYRQVKAVPYCTRCATPLSDFEASASYNDTTLSITTVTMALESDANTKLLVQTYNVCYLLANLAICVHPDVTFVKVYDFGRNCNIIVAEAHLLKYCKEFKILEKMMGSELVGLKYVPIYDYYVPKYPSAFRIVADQGAKSEDCGMEALAPCYGEFDFRVALQNNIISNCEDLPYPIDEYGVVSEPVYAKAHKMRSQDAEAELLQNLKQRNLFVAKGTVAKCMPYCSQCERLLTWRVMPCWMTSIEPIRQSLLKHTESMNWMPNAVKQKRFIAWLEKAQDWCIARTRYWGTPLPIWKSSDFKIVRVVGSLEELIELTGNNTITDLHREHIDTISIGDEKLTRVHEVLDCWFDAACTSIIEQSSSSEYQPASCVFAGLDQTKGWLYVSQVLSVALFDKPAFQNVVVNGLLASPKSKYSRYKQHPGMVDLMNKYGADALRVYILHSPILQASSMTLTEKPISEIATMKYLERATNLFETCATEVKFQISASTKYTHIMDTWIISKCHSLIKHIKAKIEVFCLSEIVPAIIQFVELQFYKYYVLMNRDRFEGKEGMEQQLASLHALFHALYNITILLAPIAPFVTENVYNKIKPWLPEADQRQSIHMVTIPDYNSSLISDQIERTIQYMQHVITTGSSLKDARNVSPHQNIANLVLFTKSEPITIALQTVLQVIQKELKATSISIVTEYPHVQLQVEPVQKLLAPRLKHKTKVVTDQLKKLSSQQIASLAQHGTIDICNEQLTLQSGEIQVVRQFMGDAKLFAAQECYNDAQHGFIMVIVQFGG